MVKLTNILKEDFPKGEYVTPTNKEKNDEKELLYNLIQNAYASIGGHIKFNSPDDINQGELKYWQVADIDEDPEIDVVFFGKEGPYGVKHTGMGHDGDRANIKNMLTKKTQLLKTPGNYVEVSGAAFDSLVGYGGVPTIDDERIVRAVLGDKKSKETEWHGKHPDGKKDGNGWYTRTIGGKKLTKIMAGVI